MRVVGYVRVSTERQAEEGLGLDVQERAIRRWAKAHGHRVVRVCTDAGVSGSVDAIDREGLACALGALQDGTADVLAVHRLDRLARTLTVQEAALSLAWRYGGQVFAVDGGEVLADDPDDPMRTFVRQVMGAAAQLEKGLIAKRLRDGRRLKSERGGFAYGAPPFGQKVVDGQLVPNDDEAQVLDRIRELRSENSACSLRDIAGVLTAEGWKPRRSDRWHPETLRRLVARL